MSVDAAEKILDVAWRQAYLSLPPRVQLALEDGNPHAEKRLIAAYQQIKTGAPNRATRRSITRHAKRTRKGTS